MSLAALPAPSFTGADLMQRTNAALTEARAARRFAGASALLADATLAYGTGARPIAAGDRIETAEGHRYAVAAAAATDHHVTTAGGVKLYVKPAEAGRFPGEAFGIRGDSAADNTALYEKAFAAINAAGGGYLVLGQGYFLGTMYPRANSRTGVRGVIGAGGVATRLRANSNGAFAADLKVVGGSAEELFTFRDLTFDGDDGSGNGRRRCGVYYEIRCDFESVEFRNCAIGIARPNAYYSVVRDCRFVGNDVDMLVGPRVAGTTAISGIKDAGGAAVSVTLPDANTDTDHAGNLLLENNHHQSGRFGLCILPTDGTVPYVTAIKCTWEGMSQAGVVTARAGVTLHDCWFEANNDGGAAVTFDGISVPAGGIVTVHAANSTLYGGAGSSTGSVNAVYVNGGTVSGIVCDSRSLVVLDDGVVLDTPHVTVATGGAVYARHAQAHNSNFPDALVVASMPKLSDGFGFPARTPHRTRLVHGAEPKGGRVYIGDRLTGSGFLSSRVSTFFGDTYTFGQAGGLWPEQTCLTVTSADQNVGPNLEGADWGGFYSAGQYVARLVTVKPEHDSRLGYNGTSAGFINIPAGKWSSVLNITRATAGETPGILHVQRLAGGATSAQFSALQVIVFDSYGEALAWAEEMAFYTAETSPRAIRNAQTGTAYTLAMADAGVIITMTNAAANVVTIPANAAVAFPIGTEIAVLQLGAGATTIAGAAGVTVNGSVAGSVAVAAQWAGKVLLKIGANEWVVS